MPDRTGHLHIFASIRPKPEYFAQAREALEQLVAPTLTEPGCHLFTVLQSRNDPGMLHLFEIFDNEEALEAHYAQEYTREVFASYKDWLAAPVEIQYLFPTSRISATQFFPYETH